MSETKFLVDTEIVVTSVARASKLLMSTHTRGDVDAVISIADPFNGKRPPKEGFYAVPHRLCLTFDDVLSADEPIVGGGYVIAPSRADAELIVDFGRRCIVRPGKRLLVHCHAGISRSTAAALIVLADRMGKGNEIEAVRALCWCSEGREPYPNQTLVRHGDDILGRDGALVKALESISDFSGKAYEARRVLQREGE